MKKLRYLSLTLAALLLMNPSAYAGCGEMEAQCLVIKGETTTPASCTITVCANASEYLSDWSISDGTTLSHTSSADKSTIRINGKPGYQIPYDILKDNLTCYGNADMSQVYCAKDVSL
ncbi:hypothetical protein KCN56_09250 [Photobacterium galatheae]|uniref:hypothetical protein n=1 Tax=Photobacterium galatheae TaxID=1654360 RepID=UPI00202CDB73|nr:hypothetical protein [Photobacterium galatheae]MCM0148745.1 hypothetical protein [Photobacterium galatheae]